MPCKRRKLERHLHGAAIASLFWQFFAGQACAGDWASIKSGLVAQGIQPNIIYNGDTVVVASGGAKPGAIYLGNLHLQLSLDGGALLGARGLTIYLDGLNIHGGSPDSFAGDAQGVSNLAAPPDTTLYEAWIQYNFAGSDISVLAGRYDINSEFDRLRSASLFLNSSFGIGPEFASSGRAGPSIFPNTALGARLTYKPAPNIVWRTAIMDGVPVERPRGSPSLFDNSDGALIVTELAYLYRPGPAMPPGQARSMIGRASNLPPYENKIAVGVWHYTATFNDLSEAIVPGVPVRRHGSTGAYAIADVLLYRMADDPKRAVSGFLQAGIGDDRVDRFGSYLGMGIVVTGLLLSRPSDQVGLAAATGRNGSHFLDAQARLGMQNTKTETSVELTYLAQVTDWLAVQPNVQYIIHPGTRPNQDNALVFQLQFETSL
jgi:porin